MMMAVVDTDPNVGVGTPITSLGPSGTGVASGTSIGGGLYGVPITHTLWDYVTWMQIHEAFFMGIRGFPGLVAKKGCGDYWDQTERYWLAGAIDKAEERMSRDRWLGTPVRQEFKGPRQLPWGWPVMLGVYVRGLGVRTITDAVAVDLSTQIAAGDDSVSFDLAVTFTDVNELVIFYPGQSKYSLQPTSVVISSGIATVKIPRCRLLDPDYLIDYDDVNERPVYTNDTYFMSGVEARRVYLDTTTGNNLVWHRQYMQTYECITVDAACNPSTPCDETLQLACGYVRDQRQGIVQFEPSTYNGGWSKAALAVKRNPDYLQVNYTQGWYNRYDEIDSQLIRAIAAIAHNNFPRDPCFKCALQQQYYKRDIEPLEPAAHMGMGPSTWGIYEAVQIIEDFIADQHGHAGGLF